MPLLSISEADNENCNFFVSERKYQKVSNNKLLFVWE
jgi:hypothetical protein